MVKVVSLRLLDVVVAAKGIKCEDRRQLKLEVVGVDAVVEQLVLVLVAIYRKDRAL